MATFEKAFNMKGFDRHRTPRWQMVPLNGTRWMILRGGAGLRVRIASGLRVQLTEVQLAAVPSAGRRPVQAGDRFFKIQGKATGSAKIQAKTLAGATAVELELNVKSRKTVNISFNFVRDNAGHATTRNTASVANWVRGLNHIYRGQSNIRILRRLSRNVTVTQNLGPVVRFSSHLPGVAAAEHEWGVVTALGDAAADMNFFYVWEYEQGANPAQDGADAGALAGNCIFEDNAGTQVVETMAHEIGHYLGRPDHYLVARRRELMYGITDTRGVHLPKQDVNVMNP